MLDLSVVIPVHNAEAMIERCLNSIVAASPREVIVVDRLSTDRTVELASRYPVTILSDHAQGPAAARMIGARASSMPWVALIDPDIEVPAGALSALFAEFLKSGYMALQASLVSLCRPGGYWGRALANHDRNSRSRTKPGLTATICDRNKLLAHGLDQSLSSGDDVGLGHRLQLAGECLSISRHTVVLHHYDDDTFTFARRKWLADARGLTQIIRKYGWRTLPLAGGPVAAFVIGVALSLARMEPEWIPYYCCYLLFTYLAMAVLGLQVLANGNRAQRSQPSTE